MSVSHYETAVALAHVEGQLFYAKKEYVICEMRLVPRITGKTH